MTGNLFIFVHHSQNQSKTASTSNKLLLYRLLASLGKRDHPCKQKWFEALTIIRTYFLKMWSSMIQYDTASCSFGVRKYFGNYFFLWFQLEVETFQVGVRCPCRGGRPNSWRGVGGEGAAPPPQMHSQNMLRAPSVCRILGALSHFFVGSQTNIKTSCALRFIFLCLVFIKAFGPLGSYLFCGLRFI